MSARSRRERVVTVPDLEPALLDAEGLGRFLGGLSAEAIRVMHRRGELPEPVRIGTRLRWRVDVVRIWIDSLPPDEQISKIPA